jgi:hypothetical protein
VGLVGRSRANEVYNAEPSKPIIQFEMFSNELAGVVAGLKDTIS